MRKRKFTMSDFVCSSCNMKLSLPRSKSKTREKGHIKDIYCPTCRKVSKFKEIRYNDYYTNWYGEVV